MEHADAEALFHAGRAAWLRNDLLASEHHLRAAAARDPENIPIRAALGATLLKAGRLTEGYPLFDSWRKVRPGVAPALPLPRWQGQPVAGKTILIWSEDGFGDQIQWARYARRLVEAGASVVWLCPRPLMALLADLGVDARPNDESIRLEGFDYYCPSSALPLGFDLSALDGRPYLAAPAPDHRGARLGIMTSGNRSNAPGAPRAMPDDLACRLVGLPHAISLAPEATGARDFRETAAIMGGLDLVVTVDTSVAHLAGGLGKPVWILIPYVGDWRWFQDREDSPWYSSAKLFRQPEEGAWGPVIERVERELA